MADVSLKLLVLKTKQLDALRDFYGALGIELTAERHDNGPLHFAGQAGDCVFEIYPLPADRETADASTRLGFAVENLMETVEALRSIGAGTKTKPQQTSLGSRAVVRDPDGRAVELHQR